jgi:hypothetical protein
MMCQMIRNRKVVAALVAAAVFSIVPSIWAHHGLARFDTQNPVTLQGTVTDFRWTNPHAYAYAEMKDEQGKLAKWKLELGSLTMLAKFGGWSRDSLKRGDHVTVRGFRAKDGSPYMSLLEVDLPNGKTLSAAP